MNNNHQDRPQKLIERIGGSGHRPAQVQRRREPTVVSQFFAWLESHRTSFLDTLRRLASQPISSFFTSLVMAVALCLPTGLSLLLGNLERLGGSWQRAAQISVYLKLDTSEQQSKELRARITALPEVAEVQWVSRQQALQEFQQQTGFGQALNELPENPLPGSFLVTPKVIDKARLEALRQGLASLPQVDQTQLDLMWVERLNALLHLGNSFVFGLSLLLTVALLLVVGNTIRLHFEGRRVEIEVITLVGGTDSYVRRPFLYMGALYGLLSGLLAWGLLAAGLSWLNKAVVRLAGLYDSDFALATLGPQDALFLVFGAVLLGYLGAWLAVSRHLRELAPR